MPCTVPVAFLVSADADLVHADSAFPISFAPCMPRSRSADFVVAMCDLGACPPPPALLPGILQLATSRRLQPLQVRQSVALAVSI